MYKFLIRIVYIIILVFNGINMEIFALTKYKQNINYGD